MSQSGNKPRKTLSSSVATQRAASKFTRRSLLKAAAAGGTIAAMGPWIVRDAFSSSGEIRVMTWSGYDFAKVKAAFEKATGMKMTISDFPDQDKMAAQMKATNGEGFDIAEPTADRVPQWVDEDFLQPLDEGKASLAGVKDAFLKGAAADSAVIKGKRYATPTVWGTETLCFNTKSAPLEYGKASYADLWKPEYVGKVTVRPHSSLVGIGLVLEAAGKLPHKMREAFSDPAKMTANYDIIIKQAIANRKSVAQFWSDENSAQGAFRTNGVVIGQNWDTSAAAMIKEGMPIGYVAAKEGAFAWLQNWVVPKKANTTQTYDFLKWFNTGEATAMWATAYGANPIGKDSEKGLSDSDKKFLAMAYPGDALEKLWWWPASPSWFVTKRNEYADKFKSA
jgi:spermidine/putrescine transport system substrate-binding protein